MLPFPYSCGLHGIPHFLEVDFPASETMSIKKFIGMAAVSVVSTAVVLWLTILKSANLESRPGLPADREPVAEKPEPARAAAARESDGFPEVSVWLTENLDSGEFTKVRYWPIRPIDRRIEALRAEYDELIQNAERRVTEIREDFDTTENEGKAASQLPTVERQRAVQENIEKVQDLKELLKKTMAFRAKLRKERGGLDDLPTRACRLKFRTTNEHAATMLRDVIFGVADNGL